MLKQRITKNPNYRSILDLKTDTLTDKYYDFYTTQDGLVDNLNRDSSRQTKQYMVNHI